MKRHGFERTANARIVWALMSRGSVCRSPASAAQAVRGREDVGAEEGKEQFGATVARRDRENQCATECLRARGFDLDPTFEHHTGPRHNDGRN